jgi:hypothetical protein
MVAAYSSPPLAPPAPGVAFVARPRALRAQPSQSHGSAMNSASSEPPVAERRGWTYTFSRSSRDDSTPMALRASSWVAEAGAGWGCGPAAPSGPSQHEACEHQRQHDPADTPSSPAERQQRLTHAYTTTSTSGRSRRQQRRQRGGERRRGRLASAAPEGVGDGIQLLPSTTGRRPAGWRAAHVPRHPAHPVCPAHPAEHFGHRRERRYS